MKIQQKYIFLVITLLFIGLKAKENEDCTIIGIDLGTTYSAVSIYKNGQAEVIINDMGNRITPSIVSFTKDGKLVGEAAKNQRSQNPENTIYDVKRLIGRQYDESVISKEQKNLPFKIIKQNNKPYVKLQVKGEEKTMSPEEISALILTKMKETAQNYLGYKVSKAVITVPAYFTDGQRQATRDAGTIAGLEVVRIINEPTAAALSYGLDKNMDSNILVYDLGGGTFDVSILSIDEGIFEVLATDGDNHLGGEDFDFKIIDYFMKVFKRKTKVNLKNNKRALSKLKQEAEKAKRALSSTHSYQVQIENLAEGHDFEITLTRAKFESLNESLFKKTLKPLKKALESSGLKKADIDEIVLVGGSTRIPKIQQMIKDFFDGKEITRGINPDEAIAQGAAITGGIICGETSQDIIYLDVTPLSLGIETVGGIMTNIIDRQSKYPTKKTQTFSTYKDNQEQVTIQVYEGERTKTKDNHFLGKFDLSGIPPAPKGVPQIEVSFELDINGILSVSAQDTSSKSSKKIEIKNSKGRLSDKEIEQMLQEAEQFEEEDRIERERIIQKNNLESYIYSIRNQITDTDKLADQINQDEKDLILEALDEAEEWLEDSDDSNTKEDYEDKQKELEKIFGPIINQLYENGKSEDDIDVDI